MGGGIGKIGAKNRQGKWKQQLIAFMIHLQSKLLHGKYMSNMSVLWLASCLLFLWQMVFIKGNALDATMRNRAHGHRAAEQCGVNDSFETSNIPQHDYKMGKVRYIEIKLMFFVVAVVWTRCKFSSMACSCISVLNIGAASHFTSSG